MLSQKTRPQRNVCLELQRRQWVAVEGWDWQLLHRYCEHRALQYMRSNAHTSSCHEVIRARDSASTVALAFSDDGNFMASGHLHHEIIVFSMAPRVQHLQTLSTHHSRTPWCLVFDPTEDLILYSGGLDGIVCKWNFESGECLKTLKTGVASPVNSITFLPSIPHHMLVAKDHWLSLVSSGSLDVVWQVSTGNPVCRVRLVLSHPHGDKILTAVANEPPKEQTPFAFSLRTPSFRTTYKLQLYPFDIDHRPNLEDSSYGLLCLSARIYGQQSCAITDSAVICISITNNVIQLKMYSVLPQTFGECLCCVDQMSNIVSLSMSPCNSFLLLGIARQKDIYHMNRVHIPGPVAKILQLNPEPDAVQKLQSICTLKTSSPTPLSCNVALWGPPRAGGGVFMGLTRGGVVSWGCSAVVHNMDDVIDQEVVSEWNNDCDVT